MVLEVEEVTLQNLEVLHLLQLKVLMEEQVAVLEVAVPQVLITEAEAVAHQQLVQTQQVQQTVLVVMV